MDDLGDLHLLLLVESCLLLRLDLLLAHLLLARLVTELVTARVLALVPATTANAWTIHYSDWHFNVATILLVNRLGFLQALNLEVKGMDLLHQLALSCSRCHSDPLEVGRELDAFVEGQVEGFV